MCCLLVYNDGFFLQENESQGQCTNTRSVCFFNIFMKMEEVLVLVVHVTHNHCQKPGPVCYNDCFNLEHFHKKKTCLVSFTDNSAFPYSLAFK